ncbi:guanylate-binding protein 1-like [Panicum miliaceum]|uniref:Guanylate-binding protein 1-like n=1 Tax=Panicum miliaceum TaxID=4540 RepID=A0A3L6QA72_PANMI|nr:guanylate-binding protein 1-like [Panicum miliaceum]
MERQVDALERDKAKMVEEIERLHQSEKGVMSKVTLFENSVEKEIDEMLKRNNQQRSSTVQVLESLLATEREACAKANKRAEAFSLQLQATQGKLDMLQQELASVQFNETALDSKLKTSQQEDGGSVFIGEDTYTGSQQGIETEEYTKLTVQKLKQELTKHGFGAQLLQLKNPNKDIVTLYEKHVVGK